MENLIINTGQKLRVVMVAPTFPLEEGRVNGGVQGASLYICRALAQIEAIDLHVVRPFAPQGTAGLKQLYGLRVHFVEASKNLSPAFDRKDIRKTFQLIKQLVPHIVHVQGLPVWANESPFPGVVTIHGISEKDVLYQGPWLVSRLKFLFLWLREGSARRNAHNVIAINPYVYQFLGSPQKQRVWDIANPVADDFFAVNRRPIPGRIFSASNMIPLKNLKRLIEAFSQVAKADPRAELRLAGSAQESKYGQECRMLVDSLGLTNRVRFLGLLSLERMQEELALAGCFALCSKQENAPLSVSEAMAAGVPVVASRICGLPWMVEDGETGMLVDPMNITNIAQSLSQVLLPENVERMGLAAKQRAADLFSPSIIAQKTFDVYREILSR